MKNINTQSKVLDYLSNNPNSDANKISEGTGIFKLNVYKILKSLLVEKQISIVAKSNPPVYILEDKAVKAKQDAIPHKIVHQERIGKTSGIATVSSKGRDTTRIVFQGKEYPKSRFVWIIIKTYIEKNPKITLAKLKEIFADELQPRYGVIQLVHQGRKLSEGRDRYFLKADEILKISGDVKICICNQWGVGNIDAFKMLARQLKFVFK